MAEGDVGVIRARCTMAEAVSIVVGAVSVVVGAVADAGEVVVGAD